MNIVTTHVFPPIPTRCFDWQAWDGDTYDPDPDAQSLIGWGATKEAAIADLMTQVAEEGVS